MPREKPMSEEEYLEAEGIDKEDHQRRKEGLHIGHGTDLKNIEKKAKDELPYFDEEGRMPRDSAKAREKKVNEELGSDALNKKIDTNIDERNKTRQAGRLYIDTVKRLSELADTGDEMKNARADFMREIDSELVIKRGVVTDKELIEFYDSAILKINEFIEKYKLGK